MEWRHTVAVLWLFASSLFAKDRQLQLSSEAMRAEAAGCVVSTISCGGSATGEITTGDCAFSNGHRYDIWGFNGVAGQLVVVTVTAIDSTLTLPSIQLIPPSGDASLTPIVVGDPGTPMVLRYKLSTSGAWGAVVSTGDLSGGGHYNISVSCFPGDTSVPQGCVTQQLSCNQALGNYLTATSCTFTDGLPYAYTTVSLAKGDYVEFDASSTSFDPYLALYRHGGASIASSFGRRSSTHAIVYFTAPATDSYQAAVYTSQGAAGSFILDYSCLFVCTAPTVTSQPVSQAVPYGGSVTLSAAATAPNGNQPAYEWRDEDFNTIGTGPSVTITNITRTIRVHAHITNACGAVESATATISAAPCVLAAATAQPASSTAVFGKTWQTSVGYTVGATAPVSFQWYQGNAHDMSRPVTGGTSQTLTVIASAPTSYWVRITNPCGTSDSDAATMNVSGLPRGRSVRH